MKRSFLSTLFFFFILWAFAGHTASQSAEAQKIDQEIQELTEMKRGYEARALRHENMAEYLQFDQQAILETRRHIQLADENRNKAALVQQEIDRLKAKQKELQR